MPTTGNVAERLHRRNGCALQQREADAPGSAAVLSACRGDAAAMTRLRQLLWHDTMLEPGRADDTAVLERVAILLDMGVLCACGGAAQVRSPVASSREAGAHLEETPPPARPARTPPLRARERKPVAKTWLQIEMVGEDEKPIKGVRYSVTLPDGSVRSGFLNAQGRARFDDIEPGQALISFPDLDRDAWEPA